MSANYAWAMFLGLLAMAGFSPVNLLLTTSQGVCIPPPEANLSKEGAQGSTVGEKKEVEDKVGLGGVYKTSTLLDFEARQGI